MKMMGVKSETWVLIMSRHFPNQPVQKARKKDKWGKQSEKLVGCLSFSSTRGKQVNEHIGL